MKSRIAVGTLFALFTLFPFASGLADADEKAEGKKSLGGSGEMIRFDLAEDDRVLGGIEVHGSRYGAPEPPDEDFLIYIMNSDRSKVLETRMAPYSLFERGAENWVVVKFDEPATLPPGGWVAIDFRAGRTKGVYVSYTLDSDGSRSMIGLPGIRAAKPNFEGDWMIRPIVVR